MKTIAIIAIAVFGIGCASTGRVLRLEGFAANLYQNDLKIKVFIEETRKRADVNRLWLEAMAREGAE